MLNKAKRCPSCGAKNKSDEWKYALAALFTVCIVICLFAAYKGNQSEHVSTDLFGYVSDLDSGYSVMKRIGISFGAADIQSVNEINKIKFTAEIIDAETNNLIFKTDYINVNF